MIHTCKLCGWETKAPAHVVQVWHPCRPAGRRIRLTPRPLPDERLDEDRTAWFTARYPTPKDTQ